VTFDYDAELRPHNRRLRAAAAVGRHDRVLDIGCGAGLTTREAARAATAGHALGVDVSEPLLERARALSADLPNIAFRHADAQVHPFPRAQFDLGISRFGTMFFADPAAAFTNIGLALRPDARLVLLVWQSAERNEWSAVFPPAPGPNPFSLADPAATQSTLTAAGFADVTFTDVHEPVYYGPDAATAHDAVLGLRAPGGRRLRELLAAHDTGDGVYFDSRAWLITARRTTEGRPS
jgi:SAM-dependent methyltransferase